MARRFVVGGELALALGISAFGVFLAVQTMGIEVSPGYARIGPRVFPWIISFALIGLGLWLAAEIIRGPKTGDDPTAAAGGAEADPPAAEPIDWNAFLTIGLGLVLHMTLIGYAGFVFASTVLFVCVARAFDSRRLAHNTLIGAILALVVYIGFQYGLGLDLPAGLLAGIL